MLRSFAVLSATAIAAGTLAGCTVETQSCKGGKCTIKLTGAGAKSQLGGYGGSYLTLLSASGNTAKIKLAETTGILKVGDPIQLTNATLVLEKVKGKDSVTISVTSSDK